MCVCCFFQHFRSPHNSTLAGLVGAQLDAHPTDDEEVGGLTPAGSATVSCEN